LSKSALNVLLVAEYYVANPDFVRLGEELATRGHNVSVATSLRSVDRFSSENGVKLSEIEPLVTIYKIPHTLSFPIEQIRRIVKEEKIDVIHTVNDHSTNVVTAALVSMATGKPFVYTIQGPGTRTGHLLVDSLVSTYDLTVERWISKHADRVILLSTGLFSTAEKLRVKRDKVAVIHSGIDFVRFNRDQQEVKEKTAQLKDGLKIQDDDVVVGYAGRLVPAKGLTYLFSAVKQIEDKHRDIVLLIVGDGAQRGELEALARDLKVRTLFAGWQRDIIPYYALMDIFVLPSFFEGLPNVVLEAMAMKNAVIATAVGGNPDVLATGENGFLVPVKNVSKLSSALARLVGDADLRGKMGLNNRLKVERDFRWSSAVEKVEKVYYEVA
jgi:glycosyltransferase involved in cell wall biosynthesis